MGIIEESKRARQKGVLGIIKNKKIIIPALAVIIMGIGIYYWQSRSQAQTTTTAPKNWTVKRADIQIAIDTDGKVVAEDGVELSFSVSGDNLEVEDVYVEEGQKIKKGDQIAAVKTDTLEFSVRSAYASYQSALASYNEKMAGATEEDKQKARDSIEQAQISLDQAKISLESTKQSEADKIHTAEQAVKDAQENLETNRDELTSEDVANAYEDLVDTVKSIGISLDSVLKASDAIIGVDDKFINDEFESSLGVKAVNSLSSASGSYTSAKTEAAKLDSMTLFLSKNSAYAEIDQAAVQTNKTLSALEGHLYDMKVMLEASVTNPDLTQSELNSFISTITSNRTAVNTKISTLSTSVKAVEDARQGLDDYVTEYNDAVRDLDNAKATDDRNLKTAESNITNKELALEQVKRSYDDLLAPLTDAEMAAARSQFTSASISLQKAQLDLKKATILSPIDGEIALLNYKAGDIITDNTEPVAVIINNDTLFIEVNIEEADISKIQVGDRAIATFDALDGAEIPGEISFISLTSQTSNNGIVTYLVRVLLDNSGKKNIREGMTAAVKFVTAGVNNVLSVPVGAVRNVEGKPSVSLVNGEWKPVTTGFTDGKYVEVISGLSEGEIIVY